MTNNEQRKTKMIFTNEKELFTAEENGINVIGATYTGEVEYGVVLNEEGFGYEVENGIIVRATKGWG